MPSKGGPSARSGHRMVVYRPANANPRLVVFGGFYDTGGLQGNAGACATASRTRHRLLETPIGGAGLLWPPPSCTRHAHVCRQLCRTGKETRYYNDAWAFDLEDYKWAPLAFQPGSPLPPPRGGHQLVLHGHLLFVFGGYYVKKQEAEQGGSLPLTGMCSWEPNASVV